MPRFQYWDGQQARESREWPPEGRPLWVDLGPEDAAGLGAIINRLAPVHETLVERVLESEDRQAQILGRRPMVVFVLSHYLGDLRRLTLHHLGVFYGAGFLLTVHLEDPHPAVSRAWQEVLRDGALANGLDMALYYLLRAHWARLAALQRQLNADFEALHKLVLLKPQKPLAASIWRLRRETMRLSRLVRPEQAIYRLFAAEQAPFVHPDHHPYFAALAGRMHELVDDVTGARDELAGLVEAYSSMQSNTINKVMQFLTLLSVLALPATTIASIYGMNFRIPEIRWPNGYFYSLVLMGLTTLSLALYVKRRGWWDGMGEDPADPQWEDSKGKR
ncbi:MAG: magnesium transporter CorA [Firmicutes bacterium]|nr:magnesium transporter CorA [Bacillota bacterium]